jgi:hypothetical protein
MAPPFKGRINIDIKDPVPDREPYRQPKAPQGAERAVGGAPRCRFSALSGAALMAASALTRFGVFEAGRASARDRKCTVGPQRQRLREQGCR